MRRLSATTSFRNFGDASALATGFGRGRGSCRFLDMAILLLVARDDHAPHG